MLTQSIRRQISLGSDYRLEVQLCDMGTIAQMVELERRSR